MTRRRAGLGRVETLLLLALLVVGWLLVALSLPHLRSRARRSACADNLRRLGIAGIEYADDKRFFPHIGSPKALDGGTDTNATPNKIRSLVWFGYHDDPAALICPESRDAAAPIADDDVRENMRLWTWSGLPRGESDTPPLHDGLPDPVLDATTELSYGWTRRFTTMGARSTALIAADRAQADPEREAPAEPGLAGNHADGVNLLQLDSTVQWVPAGGDEAPLLAAVAAVGSGWNERPGFLAVHPPTRPPTFVWRVDWIALVGLPALLAALLLGRRMANARLLSPAPAGTSTAD